MKVKFVIARAAANAYWNYYNKDYLARRLPEYRNGPLIVNEVVDGFLNGNVQEATKYDTYEQAQAEIEGFGKITHQKKDGDKVINEYPGVGIYRIDKIFVIDLPDEQS
jgi:hypothetical protein